MTVPGPDEPDNRKATSCLSTMPWLCDKEWAAKTGLYSFLCPSCVVYKEHCVS